MSSDATGNHPDIACGERKAALTRREHRRLADVLLTAAQEQRPIPSLGALFPEITEADAIEIRDVALRGRVAGGDRLVGAKISLDHRARGLRLGWLTDSMLLKTPVVDLTRLTRPRIQARVALRLSRPLRTQLADVGELLDLIDRVLPCLDVIDQRYEPPSSRRVDDIADNCGTALLAVGEGIATPSEETLRGICVDLSIEAGDQRTPRLRPPQPCRLDTALWLANRVLVEGGELEAGAFLVSAPSSPPIELRAPSLVRADFGLLGTVGIQATNAWNPT